MRFQPMQLTALFLTASLCAAQTPMGTPTSVPTQPTVSAAGTITVAQGTTVPLTLVTPIKSKSTKPGDTIRAVVAFPITVGTQQAIPAGTYVEGVVNSVTPRAPKTHLPTVQIHFTHLLFANGYSVPLDAASTEAWVDLPAGATPPANEVADASAGAPYLGEAFASQTVPQPAPLPSVGPSAGVVAGATIGGAVGVLALIFGISHHNANTDYVVFDNGWQFQMALQAPLVLDLDRAK